MTEVSWARLWTPAGVADQSIPSLGFVSSSWYNFWTNDPDNFGTNVGTTFPYSGITNTSGDSILKVSTAGIYIVDYFAQWTSGAYNRYIDISASGFDQLDVRGSTIEFRYIGSDYNYETYYGNFELTSTTNFMSFFLFNGAGVSKTVSERGVSIIKLPVDPDASSITVFS